MTEFSSEGFDLDALVDCRSGGNSSNNEGSTLPVDPTTTEVIYEIGGGVTTVIPQSEGDGSNLESVSSPETAAEAAVASPSTPLEVAEEWKQKGNDEFRKGNYLEAYDLYTEAIDACPCPIKAEQILQQKDEFNEAEREKAQQRLDGDLNRRRRGHGSSGDSAASTSTSADDEGKEANTKDNSNSDAAAKNGPPAQFELPPQEYGDKLAVFYCNRAATLMHLVRYDESIQDCDVAILLDPKYTKAFVRRSAAFESTERTDDALRDAKRALELEPSNATIRKSVNRLQKIEDDRLEKLKVRHGGLPMIILM
jgi:tetratricopeptide (TPR) repeat protein